MGGAGKQNKDQKLAQLSQQGAHNDVEFGAEQGNAQYQSQKKSGKQMNKR